MEVKTVVILVVIIGLVISGCGQGQSVEPTISPTLTPHTPDPAAVKLLEEAFSYSRQGEDEKAIETYTKAIEADPLYGQPYFNRGAIYADHRELEKALADFNKGLELDLTNPHGYSLRANVLIELDKLDEALEDIKSLLSLTKDDEYIMLALTSAGHIYLNQDKPFFAISAYTAVLEIDELNTSALLGRGQIYFKQGDWLRAFSDLVRARQMQEDPEFRQAINDFLMKVYPEGTSLEEAIKASEPYYYKAIEYDKAGDYKNASESISRAIEIDPLNPEYYFQRAAFAIYNGGNLLDAETDLSYMIALNPDDPRGYYFRGITESILGLASESIADLEKALEFDLNSDTKTRANQALKDMRQLQKSCQFTAFKTISDAENPTFEFTFVGPPNTDSIIAALSRVSGGGLRLEGKTSQDGINPIEIYYELSEGETMPIELDIRV